jgi:hypothetical protein
MPDGRRVALSTRVSEATAAALDEARGAMSRSAALDAAIAMWVAAKPAHQSHPAPAAPGIDIVTDDRMPAGRAALAPRAAKSRAGCPHPRARVVKGLCGACGTGGLG